MRAPPLSLRPMTGAPTFIAMSMTLQIFCAWRSLKRAAEHGEVLREDVDEPAVDRARAGDDAVAGDLLLRPCRSRSHCARRTCHILRSCPDRAARSSRSRAVSRPLACCAAMRFSPPPSRASSRRFSSSSMVVAKAFSPRSRAPSTVAWRGQSGAIARTVVRMPRDRRGETGLSLLRCTIDIRA